MEDKVQEIYELFRAISFWRLKNSYNIVKNCGVHPGQFLIIKLVYENNGIKQKELVEITHRERATITKTLQRLEKSGIIKKVYDNNKSPTIYLTEKGISIHNELEKMHENEIKDFSKVLDEEDLDKIINILNKIKESLTKESIN